MRSRPRFLKGLITCRFQFFPRDTENVQTLIGFALELGTALIHLSNMFSSRRLERVGPLCFGVFLGTPGWNCACRGPFSHQTWVFYFALGPKIFANFVG